MILVFCFHGQNSILIHLFFRYSRIILKKFSKFSKSTSVSAYYLRNLTRKMTDFEPKNESSRIWNSGKNVKKLGWFGVAISKPKYTNELYTIRFGNPPKMVIIGQFSNSRRRIPLGLSPWIMTPFLVPFHEKSSKIKMIRMNLNPSCRCEK